MKRRVKTRWVIVAPTCDLMSSPMTGSLRSANRFCQYGSRPMNTGTQLIAPELDVQEARDLLARLRVPVVMDALNERARAVAHADDRDADRSSARGGPADAARRRLGGRAGAFGSGHVYRVPSLPTLLSSRATKAIRWRSVMTESSATAANAVTTSGYTSSRPQTPIPMSRIVRRASRGMRPTVAVAPMDSAFART